MPKLITAPAIVEAVGNKPKRIEEFVGRVNSETSELSVARMTSPEGWVEPAQTPAFTEVTLVLSGLLRVESGGETFDVRAGQAIVAAAGQTCGTARPNRAVPGTLRCACRRSARTP